MGELDTRRARAARTESLFRETNERLEELAWESAEESRFVCECQWANCYQTLDITTDEYERVRQWPTFFVVAPGHESPEIEVIVHRTGRYLVVRKIGAGARVAKVHDPRTPPNTNAGAN